MTTTKPAAAKAPSDRKPKAKSKPKVAEDGTMTVTVGDRDWAVRAEALDDFDLWDDLDMFEETNKPRYMKSIFERLIGEGGWEQAREACTDKRTGVFRASGVSALLSELLGALDPNS